MSNFITDEAIASEYTNEKGVHYTVALFYDLGFRADIAKYVVGDKDKTYGDKTYPSLKRLYLEMEDPTEYQFATTYLDGWRHWKKLLGSPQVRKHIEEWREELELKLMSKGLQSVIEQATTDEKVSFQAAKFLADKGWIGADNRTKRAKDKKKVQQAQITDEFQDDIDRMSNLLN